MKFIIINTILISFLNTALGQETATEVIKSEASSEAGSASTMMDYLDYDDYVTEIEQTTFIIEEDMESTTSTTSPPETTTTVMLMSETPDSAWAPESTFAPEPQTTTVPQCDNNITCAPCEISARRLCESWGAQYQELNCYYRCYAGIYGIIFDGYKLNGEDCMLGTIYQRQGICQNRVCHVPPIRRW